MPDIRINQLPLTGSPVPGDFVPLDNGSTRRTTIQDLVLIGRPTASQAEAEAGVNPTKAMTPLTTKQSIAFEVGLTLQAFDAGLNSIAGLSTVADQMIYSTGVDAYATTALTPFARSILDDADAAAVRATIALGNAATLNVGTTAGTVAAGDDTRIVNAVQTGDLPYIRPNVTTNNTGDNSVAIQAAINALSARGGYVILPPGQIRCTQALTIGNGDGGTTFSTRNGVKLIGFGGGFGVSGALVPTVLTYDGPTVTTPFIDIKGRVSDCSIENMFLECNAKIGGIRAKAFSHTNIRGVKIVAPSSNSVGLDIFGGTAPTGNYNVFNKFEQINIALTTADSIGLRMDGDFATQNDTWISAFDLVRIEVIAGATNAICAHLKFVDSIDFRRCHFDNKPEPTAKGVVFDALANNGFPVGIKFDSCSMPHIELREDGTHKIRPSYFLNHGTQDLEVVPNNPNFVIITDIGEIYQHKFRTPITYGTGAGGVVTQITSKSTPVTLNSASGVVTLHNESMPAGDTKSFVLNNSLISDNDVLAMNIIGGASYGSYSLTISDVISGGVVVSIKNISTGALAEAVQFSFALVKVAIS